MVTTDCTEWWSPWCRSVNPQGYNEMFTDRTCAISLPRQLTPEMLLVPSPYPASLQKCYLCHLPTPPQCNSYQKCYLSYLPSPICILPCVGVSGRRRCGTLFRSFIRSLTDGGYAVRDMNSSQWDPISHDRRAVCAYGTVSFLLLNYCSEGNWICWYELSHYWN
jgi:hypothetical protein